VGVPAGMIALAGLAVVGYLAKLQQVTWLDSEVRQSSRSLWSALPDSRYLGADGHCIVTTLLLSEKAKIENFVEHLDKTEFHAVVRFLIVTVIILPVLPDRGYTQFDLNPRHIWQIVVLVSAIGFAGYFLARRLGERVGLWMSGLLAGLCRARRLVLPPAESRSARLIRASRPAGVVDRKQRHVRANSRAHLGNSTRFGRIVPARFLILAAIGAALCFTLRTGQPKVVGETVEPTRNPFEIRLRSCLRVVRAGVGGHGDGDPALR